MEKIEVKAPGVVKLFGEHAVVYGRSFVPAARGKYASGSVEEPRGTELRIVLSDFGEFAIALDKRKLGLLYKRYKARKSLSDYISANNEIDPKILPYATIAARLANEFETDVLGKEVSISSEIPQQSGCASSAACSIAFTVAILNAGKVKLEDPVIIDIARDGERVTHISEGAGRMDVTASYYGGCLGVTGEKRKFVKTKLNIVLVDTGPKKSTAETVGSVRKRYDSDREKTEEILDAIEECSVKGLSALAKGDVKTVGEYMYKDQELLKELGVSSERLDRVVEIAKEHGAYGAKLSGGGGGGIAIAICKDPDELIRVMEEKGFKAYGTRIAIDGARKYLK